MLCPACHADNADGSRECVSCSRPLSGGGDADMERTQIDDRTQIQTRSPESSSWTQPAQGEAAFEPGSDFGPRYRIESLLGQGGMGKVYKAYDRDVDRMVALKIVRPEFALNAGMMQRFRVELLLASQITHRN